MFKNISLRLMSFYGALAMTAFIVMALWLGDRLLDMQFNWRTGIFIILVIGLFCFFVIQYMLDRFIYRRIKLIYKIIRKAKTSVPDKKALQKLDNPILDGVEQEVQQWAETQQNEIETLKTLESYRRRFIGNVSHELKTPIFSIQGYIYTLIDGGVYDENVNMRYLERAASNVDRLLTIVQDLEEISKLESEDLVLDIQKFHIKALVREVFNDLPEEKRKALLRQLAPDRGHAERNGQTARVNDGQRGCHDRDRHWPVLADGKGGPERHHGHGRGDQKKTRAVAQLA